MARGDAPAGSTAGSPRTAVVVIAVVGAWLGHFIEYVRVAGWHGGLTQMTGAAHMYFMPAGAGLVVVVVGAAIVLKRAWKSLGLRLRNAEALLRKPPTRGGVAAAAARRTPVGESGTVAVRRLWCVVTLLQTAIWISQENLESIASGHRAPLLGVLGGAHVLAPLVQAEVALLMTGIYALVHRRFHHKQVVAGAIERLVARRWLRAIPSAPAPTAPPLASTPLQRWGVQRWQRPPPALATI